uniref:Putative helicase n=1 Tax=viral metagenome TaxID=1070528 RepID=A0A6M3L744_9ZZZZ
MELNNDAISIEVLDLIGRVTNSMLKGGESHETIRKALLSLDKAMNYFTSEQIDEEIAIAHSVLLETGGYTTHRNIQQEVENLVEFKGSGLIMLSDIYQDLKLDQKEERSSCRTALTRLINRGKLEKIETGRTGTYRTIKPIAEPTRFVKGARSHFPIKLPFGLSKLCYIHPKSIIIIAGSKSAGKTATCLHTALENQNNIPVDYFNSDMGDEEYTDRITKMGCTCEEDVRFKIYNRSGNFHDLITPEKKIFIIDFLEIHENFYEIGKPIKQIWEKLKDGIAIIGIQMKSGGMMARGGDFTKEKARLYLAMDFLTAESCSRVTIVDAKAPTEMYPDGVKGWERKVKIINGSRFEYPSNWEYFGPEPVEKKYYYRG